MYPLKSKAAGSAPGDLATKRLDFRILQEIEVNVGAPGERRGTELH
jgi:hypothetical protein